MHAPQALRRPFTDPEWLYEIKLDGYRCMAGVEASVDTPTASHVQLLTKNGADCSTWFPEVAEALVGLPGGPHVLDGEVCVLDENGVSDFNRLQERARHKHRGRTPRVTYCVFDLLVHDGERIMGLPLVERKRRLEQLVAGRAGILFVKDLPADAALFQAMTLPKEKGGLGLPIEGVVAKRKASAYHPGVRSDEWRKVKRPGWNADRIWKG
jgi:ATP-dependent DNA ligase